jgi:hypothetical protein
MTTSIDPTTRFAISRTVQAQESEKGTMILDVASGVCWELNETGGIVWKGIQEGLSAHDIVKRLALRFTMTEAAVADDVSTLLDQLRNAKLILELP